MKKSFGEKQSPNSENQISRLRSSALGQYQFKRKSEEEGTDDSYQWEFQTPDHYLTYEEESPLDKR